MPRQARIDAPGTLHHIIVRGIERCKIFKDDEDGESFVERFGKIMGDPETPTDMQVIHSPLALLIVIKLSIQTASKRT